MGFCVLYNSFGEGVNSGMIFIRTWQIMVITEKAYFFGNASIAPGRRILRPDYFMENAHGTHLVRACACQRMDDTLIFNACYRELGNHLQVRGVLKTSACGPSGDWTIKHTGSCGIFDYFNLTGVSSIRLNQLS